MAKKTINLGTPPSGVGGDTARAAFEKVNSNFDELYAADEAIRGELSGKADEGAVNTALATKQPKDATLTALAALVTAANKLVYATGEDQFDTTDLTEFARSLLGDANAAAVRGRLGLKSGALADILGTVSQSGGIPTGAIIERGSNANGEYVRFADGTQVCIYRIWRDWSVTTALATGIYLQDDPTVWTFPAAFSAPPVVTGGAGRPDGTSYRSWLSFGREESLTHITSRILSTGSSSQLGLVVTFQAVGRWY